ncbi:MAG: hypothetical protein HXY34_05280 [Candidatus Thorarchaeota archaeon]|nr:hypothetical protein [Candidatus Thorarchaeota archaeon]
MRYDWSFLLDKGIVTPRPVQGTVTVRGLDIGYLYDTSSRLTYVECSSLSAWDIFRAIRREMLVDYVWITTPSSLHVFRTYGDVRVFAVDDVQPDAHSRALLEDLSHSSLPLLFSNAQRLGGLSLELTELTLRLAEGLPSEMDSHFRVRAAHWLVSRSVQLMLSGFTLPASERVAVVGSVNDDRNTREWPVIEAVVRAIMNAKEEGEWPQDHRISLAERPPCSWCEDSDSAWQTALSNSTDRLRKDLGRLVSVLLGTHWSADPWAAKRDSATPSLLAAMNEHLNGILDGEAEWDTTVSLVRLRKSNRATGTAYTPEEIAHDITCRTLSGWVRSRIGLPASEPIRNHVMTATQRKTLMALLRDLRILDPAMGAGAFLLAAANWLDGLYTVLEGRESDSERRTRIVVNNLHGVDLSDQALRTCATLLRWWCAAGESGRTRSPGDISVDSLRLGNSLIGLAPGSPVHSFDSLRLDRQDLARPQTFHWTLSFPGVFNRQPSGFDVIVGNPPYGNIVSQEEKRLIRKTYPAETIERGQGTWNCAALFVARTLMLASDGGWIGLLLPNSVLRTAQFSGVRQLLREKASIREIVDEGSPFRGVTLEMVSIIAEKTQSGGGMATVTSKRPDISRDGAVRIESSGGGIISLYRDSLLEEVEARGRRGVLSATRGSDLPRAHTSNRRTDRFCTDYATTGRSIKQYWIDPKHLRYADETFTDNRILVESFNTQFLVATKNLPFPRVVMKPRGTLHGGGVVRIELKDSMNPKVIGVILNSLMIRYICVRYLTNYSQLTTCLNTGIMEELPIVYPRTPSVFEGLFDYLSTLAPSVNGSHDPHAHSEFVHAVKVADALVYETYLSEDADLALALEGLVTEHAEEPDALPRALHHHDTLRHVDRVFSMPDVVAVCRSPRMQAS